MARLDERKRRVLELLTLGGLTQKQAAEDVGVVSSTVSQWLRRDPEFKRQLDAWRAGPPPDAVTLAQSRRIIIDELARRVLHERSTFSIRELLTVDDRLGSEATTPTQEAHDDGSADGVIELTPEQAERVWAEVDGESGSDEAGAPDRQTQP